MKVRLKEFLRQGMFGLIRLASSRADVEDELGLPNDWGFAASPREADIWKYGVVEISFDNNLVNLIAIYFANNNLPTSVQIEDFSLTQRANVEKFTQYLSTENLPYQVDEFLTFDAQVCLTVGAGIKAIFEERGQRLFSLQLGSVDI
jgi:hypothetical protein